MKLIDYFLNQITIYRLVLYELIIFVTWAAILGLLGKLPFDGRILIWSTLFLVAVSFITNKVFAWAFEAPTNTESVYITALILALIITPASTGHEFIFLGWAAILATASKFILAIKTKHIFNPVAISVLLTSFFTNQSASWWVGSLFLTPLVIIGGWLLVRKLQREEMVWYFVATVMSISWFFALVRGGNLIATTNQTIFHTAVLFFAFIMLTEPLTSPYTKKWQLIYAVLVGILFSPQIHFGGWFFSPESALVVGNIMAFVINPKTKLILKLNEKLQIAPNTFDFIFPLEKRINFAPGQYMEWTFPHQNPDDRGNRRYFTLASSPTEDNVRFGVKFNNPASSFKKSMLSMKGNTQLAIANIAGDFVMPKDVSKKLVFIAGGIGITPFRSMVKYLIDKKQKRDVVLMYSNKTEEEIVYKDVFDMAIKNLGIKVIYINSDKDGQINRQMIENNIPDFTERTFYLSGPHTMVTGFEEILKKMGMSDKKIIKDFFPGFV